MPKLIIFSSVVLFALFYHLSGGADFEPRERVVTSQAPFATQAQNTRSTPVKFNAPIVSSAAAQTVATSPLAQAPQSAVAVVTPAAMTAPAEELRPSPMTRLVVSGNRVNLRAGPGTTYEVLDTLSRGTAAEVISQNDDGWAQIRLQESGKTGWMAARLLAEG